MLGSVAQGRNKPLASLSGLVSAVHVLPVGKSHELSLFRQRFIVTSFCMLLHAEQLLRSFLLTGQVMQSQLYLTAIGLELDLHPHNRLSVRSHYPMDCGFIPGSSELSITPMLSAGTSKAREKMSFCNASLHFTSVCACYL